MDLDGKYGGFSMSLRLRDIYLSTTHIVVINVQLRIDLNGDKVYNKSGSA